MTRFRFKEKYPRGRRGSPAKGVVREKRSQGSNPCFSAIKTRRYLSGFYYASKRDFARRGASCRLRREPRLARLTASEERSKRLHLRKSNAADIENKWTQSVKCKALARKRNLFSVDAPLW